MDMTQDAIPAPARAVAGVTAPEGAPVLSDVPVNSRPNPSPEASAPDPFAVGVRVLRMAPAWLLAMTVGCSTLVLLLGWMNAGGAANAVALPSALNDARSSRVESAAGAARPAAVRQPEAAAPAAPPKEGEKARAESPAAGDDAGAKFTVQVGSFNKEAAADERVSTLRAEGFDSHIAAAEIEGRGIWYRVQVGRFAERGEASKTLASLRAKGAAGAIVVPLQY